MSDSSVDSIFPKNRYPRLTSWWTLATLLSVLVLFFAPAQLPVTLYKLNLIALAAVAGYWIDRSIFPYARPNIDALKLIEPLPIIEECAAPDFKNSWPTSPIHDGEFKAQKSEFAECCIFPGYAPLYYFLGTQIRRALIVSATILAVSLGA